MPLLFFIPPLHFNYTTFLKYVNIQFIDTLNIFVELYSAKKTFRNTFYHQYELNWFVLSYYNTSLFVFQPTIPQDVKNLPNVREFHMFQQKTNKLLLNLTINIISIETTSVKFTVFFRQSR